MEPDGTSGILENNIMKVKNALDLAYRGHDGQFRKGNNLSGVKLPYICHPVDVANLLNKWNISDEDMIAAAFMHDLLEDTDITIEHIDSTTNGLVASYVHHLTFYGNVSKQEYIDGFAYKPVQILLIKMADRIVNVRDFQVSSPDYADKYALKAKNVFKSFYDREDEIIKMYGKDTFELISKDIPSCVILELMDLQ
jgi:GTP pyrophosphokinase